jgi:hypothetical protein
MSFYLSVCHFLYFSGRDGQEEPKGALAPVVNCTCEGSLSGKEKPLPSGHFSHLPGGHFPNVLGEHKKGRGS